MLAMEKMVCYPQYICFRCPECGSEEVASCENTPCTKCGNSGVDCEKLWFFREDRRKFYNTGKTT